MDELGELFNVDITANLALSYSRLSDFDRNGPKALNKSRELDPNGEGIKIGSLVDDLLLNKGNFNKLYYLYDGTKPTATLGKLADIIFNNYKKIPSKNTILKVAQKNGFWMKWTEEKVISSFDIPEFWNYLKAMYASKKKILVGSDDIELAKKLVEVLTTHAFSRHIFINGLEHYNQFKFSIKYKGFILRGVMDKILIDHKNKLVYMIDLKTGKGPVEEFEASFIKWRYYLQEAVYVKAFSYLCETLGLKGYNLMPFKFLYISRTQQIPLSFTVTKKWHKAALNGFTTAGGWRYKGLDELIDDVRWHLDNKVFDVSKKVAESNGLIPLADDFIYLDK